MKRRSFLKVVGGAAGGVAAGLHSVRGAEIPADLSSSSVMPKRVLGRTGFKISVIGFPGLALTHYDQATGTHDVHAAFDRGLNYYDVAPAYGANGDCEIKLGVALQGLNRDRYILSCKTKQRGRAGALEELERSLKRLKTDHFDLYQLHHLVKPDEDVKKALGPDGAMEAILKAKEQGKVRAIGFSAHTTKAALEALNGFAFDTVMFPLNYTEYFTRGFGKEVLALAKDKGAVCISIKPMNAGSWPRGAVQTRKWWYRSLETQEDINLCFRFSLSLPGVIAGIPPGWLDLTEKAVTAGHAYQPITPEETKKLEQMAAGQGSIFKREEDSVAFHQPHDCPYPHHPHECGSSDYA